MNISSVLAIAVGIIILWRIQKMSEAIDTLIAAVEAEDTVIDSAITMLTGLPQLIADAVTAAEAGDAAAVTNLIANINAKKDALAAAIAANTPAAPTA